VNLDIASHDVRSDDPGPDTQPWCTQLNFPAGRCPLFFTGLIGLGQTTPVLGLENLEPGRNYDFHCSLHSWMKGTLVVPPSV
jgi:hypothetical protein